MSWGGGGAGGGGATNSNKRHSQYMVLHYFIITQNVNILGSAHVTHVGFVKLQNLHESSNPYHFLSMSVIPFRMSRPL